jgi:hypothetical protein
MLRAVVRGVVVAAVLAAAGCGGDGDDNPLARYAGVYDVTEAFAGDVGTGCPAAPTEVAENTITVAVDGNEFEAVFADRWDLMRGEIREDGTFLASGNLGPEQTLRLSGSFTEDDLDATLDHVRSSTCTRRYDVSGSRRESP